MAQRQLLASWSRMLPELLRFSSANHLLKLIPDSLQDAHRRRVDAPTTTTTTATTTNNTGSNKPTRHGYSQPQAVAPSSRGGGAGKSAHSTPAASSIDLWAGWNSGSLCDKLQENATGAGSADEEEEEMDLDAFGL